MSTPSAPLPPRGTYFVAGATGFIGTHLVHRLIEADCAVIGVDKDVSRADTPGVTYVECDITSRSSVRRALAGHRIDHAIHLAAIVGDWGDRSAFERVNVDGTRNVLEEVTEAGVKSAIHISSIAAMGFDPGVDAGPEIAPVPEGDAYSSTKAKGELAARSLQLKGAPIVVIRPGDVIGPGS